MWTLAKGFRHITDYQGSLPEKTPVFCRFESLPVKLQEYFKTQVFIGSFVFDPPEFLYGTTQYYEGSTPGYVSYDYEKEGYKYHVTFTHADRTVHVGDHTAERTGEAGFNSYHHVSEQILLIENGEAKRLGLSLKTEKDL